MSSPDRPPNSHANSRPNSPPHGPLLGILWILLSGLCFVAMTALVKHVGDRIPSTQAAFLRFALGIVFVLPMLRSMLTVGLDRQSLGLVGLRGVVHTGGVILWFFAMTQIPLAEVTAMNYLTPIYLTLGGALFFGERLAARRIAAIGVALVGALIILRPGLREVSPGHLAMLGTSLLLASSFLIAKSLTARMPALAIVGWMSATVTVGLAPLAALNWVPPTWEELAWLFLVATFATAGHYCLTRSFQAAPLAVTQPVTFLQLVWSTTLGVLVFAEPLDGWVIFGGTMIIASVSFIAWREAVLKRRQTPPAEATKL